MEKMTQASNSQFFVSDACNSFSLRPSGQHESWPWQSEAGCQDIVGILETAGMCMKFCQLHSRVSSSRRTENGHYHNGCPQVKTQDKAVKLTYCNIQNFSFKITFNFVNILNT